MIRSEEHTSELQSPCNLVCRLLLEKKNKRNFIQQEGMEPHPQYKKIYDYLQAGGDRVAAHAQRKLPFIFFFNDTATTEIYTLSLHDALPIWFWFSIGCRARPDRPAARGDPLSWSESRERAHASGRPAGGGCERGSERVPWKFFLGLDALNTATLLFARQ